MNVLFIRDLIYRLKQDFGQRMELYVPTTTSQNIETGVQTICKKVFRIPRVVLLTSVLQRRFVHDVAFLTAGRNFAFGGLFDENNRTVILDAHDVPKNIQIDDSCYFIYNHQRYDVSKVELLEHRCAFVIDMKYVSTRLPYEEIELRVDQWLQWTGAANAST